MSVIIHGISHKYSRTSSIAVASLNMEVNSRLAKHTLLFNGCLAKQGLTSLVKEATGINVFYTE